MNRATVLYTGGTIGLLVGCLLSIIATDELRLSLQSDSSPYELSAGALATVGPAGHAYISLSQFAYRWGGSLGESRDRNGSLDQAWIPLAPVSARPPSGGDVCAIVMMAGPGTWANVQKTFARGRITGVIKTRGGVAQTAELMRRNPGLRAGECWEIWEGKTPWPLPAAAGAVLGGVFLFSLGLLLVNYARRHRSAVDHGATATVAFMSPLIFLMDGLTQVFGMMRLGKQGTVAMLCSAGLSVLGLGGWLISKGEWLSLGGSIGWAFAGMMCVYLGVGLLTVAVAAALRKRQQQAESCQPTITIQARQVGPFIAGIGAAPVIFALVKWRQGDPLPAWGPIAVGVGVVLVIVGLYLCVIGRASERFQEFGRVRSDS